MADCWITHQVLAALGHRKMKHVTLYLQIMLEVEETPTLASAVYTLQD